MADEKQDALRDDPGMQGRVEAERKPGEQDRMEDAGSAEAKAVRGIDTGPRGEPGDRQEVESPEAKLGRVSSYTGSLTRDREGRQNPDAPRGMQRGGNIGPNETSGSQGPTSSEMGGE